MEAHAWGGQEDGLRPVQGLGRQPVGESFGCHYLLFLEEAMMRGFAVKVSSLAESCTDSPSTAARNRSKALHAALWRSTLWCWIDMRAGEYKEISLRTTDRLLPPPPSG